MLSMAIESTMQNVIIMSVFVLKIIMLDVIVMNVVAPMLLILSTKVKDRANIKIMLLGYHISSYNYFLGLNYKRLA